MNDCYGSLGLIAAPHTDSDSDSSVHLKLNQKQVTRLEVERYLKLLNVEPLELKVQFELKKQISCSLQLSNKIENHVAFKVKTTNLKKYCVRPNTGPVLPRSICDVTGLEAWSCGNFEEFGKLISASGLSSIQNYECGCEPLIQLYEILSKAPGVYGAWFNGAGFRGCYVAFVNSDYADKAASFVKKRIL
ncbi:putative galacturonokinase [Helianthus debilis subsp. tardiflorus]